jgi:phage shock protein A
MTWMAVAAAVIGALGGLGGLAAFAQALFGRPKIKADAANVLTGSALEIVRQIQDREGRLQGRVRDLEDEIDQLHRRLRDLERSLAEREATIHTLRQREKP